jgi:putative endonuclease
LFWNKPTTVSVGQKTEQLAAEYLIAKALVLRDRNFKNRQGEIDLIMQEQATIVFVEVKYRKNASFGGAISAITTRKQQKIKQCAAFYLQQLGLNEYNTPCRFDVITLQGDVCAPQITWLKNAF